MPQWSYHLGVQFLMGWFPLLSVQKNPLYPAFGEMISHVKHVGKLSYHI